MTWWALEDSNPTSAVLHLWVAVKHLETVVHRVEAGYDIVNGWFGRYENSNSGSGTGSSRVWFTQL